MNIDDRLVAEGVVYQGENEEIPYSFSIAPWGSSPTDVAVVVEETTNDYDDVTSTVMPDGSPSVAGDVITLPVLKALTLGSEYLIRVNFATDGKVMEVPIPVICQR